MRLRTRTRPTLRPRSKAHERKNHMSSTTETTQPQIGNGDGASAPAMVQEEELRGLPRDALPKQGTGTRVAYDMMTNELLLDGSARLNLATFVTTWMPPDAARLMAETADPGPRAPTAQRSSGMLGLECSPT